MIRPRGVVLGIIHGWEELTLIVGGQAYMLAVARTRHLALQGYLAHKKPLPPLGPS